ncbi:YfhO family protein [Mycoplasmatota bacterium]|nr:YfhO family protein [Mycoplasmatota bacterium]
MKINDIIEKIMHKKLGLLTNLGISLLILVITFWNFLTFQDLFLYDDIGSDTVNQFWPSMVMISRQISNFDFPFWSFTSGLGKDVYGNYIFNPFTLIPMLFGPKLVIYILPYMEVIKRLLISLFVYKYTTKLGIKPFPSIIASILYTFCAHIVIRGTWYHYSIDGLVLILLLYAFELFLHNKNKFMMPLVFFLIIGSRGMYYVYLYSLILCVYGFTRYFYVTNKIELKSFLKFSLSFAFLYAISLAINAFILFPSIYNLLNSPRVSGDYSKTNAFLHSKIFSLNDINSLFVGFSSFLSGNILGIGSRFKGILNYLEAPNYYIGLFSIILIPQLFIYIKRDFKKHIPHLLLLILIFVYLVNPYFRYFLNGFSGGYYKISSFWVSAALIFLSMYTLDSLFQLKFKLNKTLVILTSFGLLIFLSNIQTDEYYKILILIIIYTALFIFLCSRFKYEIKLLLLGLIITELTLFSYYSTNKRFTVSPKIISNGEMYYDSTNQALSYIKSIDTSFYRVNKTYWSKFLNDSQIQDYSGTKIYSGFNTPSYIEFLDNLDVPLLIPGVQHYIKGFDGRENLNTLVGVKYLLSKKDINKFGYKQINKVNDIYIYENEYYLPLGYTYDHYISLDNFNTLNNNEKDELLLKAAVINSDSGSVNNLTKFDLSNLENKSDTISITEDQIKNAFYRNIDIHTNNFPKDFSYTATGNDPQIILPVTFPENSIISIDLTISSQSDRVGQIFWKTNDSSFNEEDSKNFIIGSGSHDYTVHLNFKNPSLITALRLDIGDSPGKYQISKFIIEDNSNYKKEYEDDIKKLKENSFEITKFNDSNISGRISLEKEKLLVLSIPYSKGWSVKVDGKEYPYEKVNVGFIGLFLPEGNHNIELQYRPPYFSLGLATTIISGILLTFILIYEKRIRSVYDDAK